MTDFFLLPLVGIFRKDSIDSITPALEDDFGVNIVPPNRSNEQFSITIFKTISVNVEVRRTKGEPLTDISFRDFVSSSKTYDIDGLLEALFLKNDDGKTKGKIKTAASNYTRRLEKLDDYKEKLAAIQPFSGTETYETQLALIKNPMNDSELISELIEKQYQSLANLEKFIISALDDISGKYLEDSEEDVNEEDEEEVPLVLEHLDSEENVDAVNTKVQEVLTRFYSKVLGCSFNDFMDDENFDSETVEVEGEYDAESLDHQMRAANFEDSLETAKSILDNEETLRNNTDTDSLVSDTDSPVE